MRRGDWPVPHFYLPRSALIVPGTRWWALPCPLCPSMSPKSSVSGVVRVHPCARVCARGTESCLVSVLCGQMEVGLFLLSLCFSLSFFIPSHPHRTLPSTQTLISQISEKVGRFHFLSIYSSLPTVPVSWDQRARSAPSGSLQPCLPASWPLLSVRAGWQAGPGMGGQASCPACPCCLNP